MKVEEIRTGDIFYYEVMSSIDNTTTRFRCRVLFVGKQSIYYDSWRDELKEWMFVPVRKNLSYYKFPISQIHRLHFDGHEPIDEDIRAKLFIGSPEILLNVTKKELKDRQLSSEAIDVRSKKMAYIPQGPKRGTLKPVLWDADQLTSGMMADLILDHQDLDFIDRDDIVLIRSGLCRGWPSYVILPALPPHFIAKGI